MSVKYSCDGCTKEVKRNYVDQRYQPSRHMNARNINAEVLIAIAGTWNEGHLCKECLLAVLTDPACEWKS